MSAADASWPQAGLSSAGPRKGITMATWLITGCSAGLGRALATAVLDRGENVVVTARDAASVEDSARW